MERFRNRSAVFVWGFAVVWVGLLGLMTHVLFRDGPPAGHSPLLIGAIFLFFWLGGFGLLAFAASRPCIFVVVDGRSVAATWRYPHRAERRTYPVAHMPPAEVSDGEDSDGDPYYYARVTLPEGRLLDLGESHDRATCEQVCIRFNAALDGGT
ncbi:MAG: hypothetical protein U1F10_02235 [Burkholderiales bacterium]